MDIILNKSDLNLMHHLIVHKCVLGMGSPKINKFRSLPDLLHIYY